MIALAALLLLSGTPAPLKCLERFYAVTATRSSAGTWSAVLPGGESIPWDDGRTKSFEEKLAAPDVKDAFSIRYRAGGVEPVTQENDDPGRIRLDGVFKATYGASAKDVEAELVPVRFAGTKLRVHRKAREAFEAASQKLTALRAKDPSIAPFLRNPGGTFNWRVIAGTDRPSAHSYGVSVDLNVDLSDYWEWQKPPLRWKNRFPASIVEAMEQSGFIWGGRWYHFDTMHFELRPELLDDSCLEKPGP